MRHYKAFLLLLVVFSLFSVQLASASIQAKKDYTVFWHTYDDDYYNSAIGVYSDIAKHLNSTNFGTDNTTGKVNESVDFVKANNDYQRMNFTGQTGQYAYTIMLWMNPDTTYTSGGTREFLVDFNTSTSTTLMSMGGGGDQSADCTGETFFLYDSDTAGETCYYGNIGGGTWHHVAWRWNSTNTRYELMLNGSLVSTDSGSTGGDYVPLTAIQEPLIGGREVSNTPQISTLYNGKIDEFAIYNISLTYDEIRQAYNNMSAGVTWPFGNFTGGGGGGPGNFTNYTFKISPQNNVTGGAINGFCSSFNSSLTLCNTTGNTVSYTSNYSSVNWNISVYNVSGGTWYNYSIGPYNWTASSDQTTYSHHYQAIIKLNATQAYTNNQIKIANATNGKLSNLTSSTVITLKALNGTNNLDWSVAGNYSENNITCTINAPLSTDTCSIGGVYDNKFTITANYNGIPITGFRGTAHNASLITNTTTFSGINGTFNLLQNYIYTFTYNNSNHTIGTANLTANASTNFYNFTVYKAQTFNLTIRDEITRELINETVTIEIIGELSASNYTTSNGSLLLELLTPDFYSIRYRSQSYSERDYYLNLTPQSYYTITLYGLNFTDGDDVLISVGDTEGNAVEGAIVKLLRYYVYCNCYEVVEMSRTSYSGGAYFSGQYYEGFYKWIVEYNNVVYFISSTPENFVPAEGDTIITRTFTINLGTNYYTAFTGLSNVGGSCNFNPSTGTLSFTWSDTTDTVTRGCIDAKYIDGIRLTNVGPSCQSGSTGSVLITLNDTNTTNYQYTGRVKYNGDWVSLDSCSGWTNVQNRFSFGNTGIFMSIGLYALVVMAFTFSATAMLIVSTIVLIFLSVSGIVPFTLAFLSGMAITSIGLGVYVLRR